MTNIRATCPTCGEVELTADDIELRISGDEDDSTYGFDCPTCICRIMKPADSRIIQLLLSGGVKATIVEDQLHIPSAPAFTYDDLLDFHIELESSETLHALLADS